MALCEELLELRFEPLPLEGNVNQDERAEDEPKPLMDLEPGQVQTFEDTDECKHRGIERHDEKSATEHGS